MCQRPRLPSEKSARPQSNGNTTSQYAGCSLRSTERSHRRTDFFVVITGQNLACISRDFDKPRFRLSPQHHQNRHTPQSPRRKRGLDLELESPGDSSAPTAAAAAGKARAATKAKKPSTRSRRGAGRTRTTTAAAAGSRGSSADPAGNAEAPEPAIASRRKAPAARKTRAARGYGAGSAAAPIEIVGEEKGFISSDAEGGRVQASPTARRNRDRSPSRRGAGRPDRWADRGGGGGGARKPSSPLSSPLRPITNYTSEGDRQPRTRAKVRGWRDDGWVGECACYACGEGCLLGIATLYCCATAVHRGVDCCWLA